MANKMNDLEIRCIVLPSAMCVRACVEKHVKYCIFIEIHNQSPSHRAINKDQTIGPSEEYLAKVFLRSFFLIGGEEKSKTNYTRQRKIEKSPKRKEKDLSLICVMLPFEFNQIIVVKVA